MAEEVAALNVRLEATAARFEREMQRARQTLDRQIRAMERRVGGFDRRMEQFGARFGKQLVAGLGAFAGVQGVRSLFRSFEQAIDKLDGIAKAADRIGISSEGLQELRHAAELSGVSTEQLETGLQRLARTAQDASRGMDTAEQAFARVGVSVTDADGNLKDLDTLLAEVADGLAETENATTRLATAQELFGRGGAPMVNLLAEGAEGLARMRQEARDLGIVLADDLVRDAEKMNDQLSRVFSALEARWNAFLITFARGLDRLFDFIPDDTETALSKRIEELQSIQDTLARRAAGTGFENFLAGPTAELERRESQLLAEIRALEELRRAREAARGFTAGAEDGGGVAPAGGGGGAREREKASVDSLLVSLEREINALDARAAAMRLSAREAAQFLAETDLLNRARELGIELTERDRELIALWASDYADARERVDDLAAALEEQEQAQRDAARAAEDARRRIEATASTLLSAVGAADSFADALKRVGLALANIAISGLSEPGGGILGSIFGSLGGIFGGSGGAPSASPIPIPRPGFAKGAAFRHGNVIPFARGGVVKAPTVFPMADGMGLMGEAGPEAVLPLRRGPGGRLGVEASGGNVTYYEINAPGADPAAIARLETVIRELAGPGKVERRAIDAVFDANARGRRFVGR